MGKGKRLKEERVLNPMMKPPGKEVARIEIIIRDNDQVTVNGFPPSLKIAMDMIHRGQVAVAKFFEQQAREGKSTDSRILTPQPGLVLPGGSKVAS